MSGIMLLALANRYRQLDSQRRQNEAERKRREARRRRKNNNNIKTYSYDAEERYSFEDHIRKIVVENPNYSKYIDAIYEESILLDNAKRFELEKDFNENAAKIIEQEKVILSLKKQIEESGITVASNDKLGNIRIDQEETEGQVTFNIGSHTYTYKGYPITFNGIRIDKNILEQDGKNYQQSYEQAVESNPNIDEILEEDRKKLARQEAMIKLPFMDTYSREERIRQLKETIRFNERIQEDISQKKKKMDTFKSLTGEQKELIGRYLEEIEKYMEMFEPLDRIIQEYSKIGTQYSSINSMKLKWEEASEIAIQSGKITDEDRKEFYNMLSSELQNVQTSYPEGIAAGEVFPNRSMSYEGPLSWMIRYEAIEYARREKDRLQDEEKDLDETIDLTKKRDELIKINSEVSSAKEGNEQQDR